MDLKVVMLAITRLIIGDPAKNLLDRAVNKALARKAPFGNLLIEILEWLRPRSVVLSEVAIFLSAICIYGQNRLVRQFLLRKIHFLKKNRLRFQLMYWLFKCFMWINFFISILDYFIN